MAKNEIKTQMHERLIFLISIFLLLDVFISGVQAQSIANTNEAMPPPTSTPTKIPDENIEILAKRLSRLDEQVNKLFQESKLTSRLELLIDALSAFSTITLGVFALIGGLLVWNGFALRREAKEDIAEIKELKKLSTDIYVAQQAIFVDYKRRVEVTIKNADKNAQLLARFVKQANQDSKTIKEAKDAISNYKRSKTNYSQAAIEMARNVINGSTKQSIKEEKTLRQMVMRMRSLGI